MVVKRVYTPKDNKQSQKFNKKDGWQESSQEDEKGRPKKRTARRNQNKGES